MAYTRGVRSDFDEWETEHENPGWGFEGILPYFKKVRPRPLHLPNSIPLPFSTFN